MTLRCSYFVPLASALIMACCERKRAPSRVRSSSMITPRSESISAGSSAMKCDQSCSTSSAVSMMPWRVVGTSVIEYWVLSCVV